MRFLLAALFIFAIGRSDSSFAGASFGTGRPSTPSTPTQPAQPSPTTDRPQEAGAADAERCTGNCGKKSLIEDLQKVVGGKVRFDDLLSWRRSRGLVQIPTEGDHTVGPCGTTHYDPGSPDWGKDKNGDRIPNDNYATPITACLMMSSLQDWKKTECPDTTKGCRINWGDISHKDQRLFNKHVSHTDGKCFDMRPIRAGDKAVDDGLNWYREEKYSYKNKRGQLVTGKRRAIEYYPCNNKKGQSVMCSRPTNDPSLEYDREKTRQFIEMVRAKGGSVLFNDSQLQDIAKYTEKHDNHLHVCFPESKKTNEVCNDFKYDPAICEGD